MEVSFVSLLNCKKFGWWVEEEEDDPHPLPTPPLNGHPELVRWAMRRRRKMTPTPYPPTPRWSSRVGEMSNEEEEEDDPHPPTPKWSSRVGEMSNEEEEEDDPHPLPTPPQMVLTVKNSRWVIICVFHAHLPCTHYTTVPAYWDPEGLASLYLHISLSICNMLIMQWWCTLVDYMHDVYWLHYIHWACLLMSASQ